MVRFIANNELREPGSGSVPEHFVFKHRGSRLGVYHQTPVVIGHFRENLPELVVGLEHTRVVLVQSLDVRAEVVSQQENKVEVRAQLGVYPESVLHRQYVRDVVVAAVLKQFVNHLVFRPQFLGREAVVHHEQQAGIDGSFLFV